MKIFGRLTIYGEYLMHSTAYGLIEKSNLYLATGEHDEVQNHPQYDVAKDIVARYIEAQKIKVYPGVKGNLPIGYGLASSSVLSFLYLYPLYGNQIFQMINNIDKSIHGFEPSGLDAGFCCRQENGLYKDGEWIDVSLTRHNYSLVLFSKEKKMTLSEVQKRVMANSNNLKKIADVMTNLIIKNNHIPYDYLQYYANELSDCDVYSNQVKEYVGYMSSKNIVAKGVGGLYDKAVIVIWPDNISKSVKLELIKETLNQKPLDFIEMA